MSVKTKLQSLFGWSSGSPPPNKSMKGEPDDFTLAMNNPYSAYTNSVKPPIERRRRYDIYDDLDELPEISSILDAYSEDATQLDRERKAAVWIEAKDRKVKEILDDLFERLKIEEYISAITRDTGKYGDDFAVLDFEDEVGIVGWDWHDPRDLERVENNQGTLVGFELSDKLKSLTTLAINEIDIEYTFKPWDVIHFRMYKRKRVASQKFRNIYGSSLLAGSERIGKQVKILDDMLMVRRLTKTLDIRKYNVDVGRSSVEEEIAILKRWKNALKRKAYIDPSHQRFDSTFDPFTWSEDLFWAVREGSNSSVEVIQGQPNVADIVDIQHFQNKLFGALRAPKGYFGFEGDVNAKATLAAQDMKWGRAVNALQRGVRNGLTRLCQIELALHNADPFAKFSVEMVVPSVLEDLSRLEATQTLIDIADRMSQLGESLGLKKSAWRLHILQSVLGMTSEDIDRYVQPDPDSDSPHIDSPHSTEVPDADEPANDRTGVFAKVKPSAGDPEVDPAIAKDRDVSDLSEQDMDALIRRLVLKKVGRTTMEGCVSEFVRRDELPIKDKTHRKSELSRVPFEWTGADEELDEQEDTDEDPEE